MSKRPRRNHAPASWLMIRRTLGTEDKEVKFYLSNAPETVSLSEMAWVGCQRWSIEVDFKLAKGEAGLDHYKLTKYRGWYHHITLSMLVFVFLKAVQRKWGEKNVSATVPEIRRLLEIVLPRVTWSPENVIA